MKRLLLIAVLLYDPIVYAQNVDSLVGLIYKEKTDLARMRRIFAVVDEYGNMNPVRAIEVNQHMLALTKQHNDPVAESVVSAELGYLFLNAGSTVQGSRMIVEAVKMAEATDNPLAIGIAAQYQTNITDDPLKDRLLYEKTLKYTTIAGHDRFTCWALQNLTMFYLSQEFLQTDSALYCAERGYRLAIAKNEQRPLLAMLLLLSKVHLKLGNNGLALEYIRTAERLPYAQTHNRERGGVYNAYCHYYQTVGQNDSVFVYAYKSLECAKRTFIVHMVQPVSALRRLYAGKNSDSALKYTNLYLSVKDSIETIKEAQQVQAMVFEEEMRQEKLDAERKHNLQYAAIAIGLLVFAILFLLFSHSVIASARVIKYLGIFSLLIVFEFVNLLIHPYLGDLTHHSPVIMLGFMVCLAAMLIPMHHKLEHWITHRMVEKNNKIRLAAAKKTIEQLEGTKSSVEQR